MIEMERIQEYCEKDAIIVSLHAMQRLRQREIQIKDIRNCIITGEIIEQYPDDFPFPSCLIYGTSRGRVLHVVASDEGSSSRIITAYFPDTDKFKEDLKTRRR